VVDGDAPQLFLGTYGDIEPRRPLGGRTCRNKSKRRAMLTLSEDHRKDDFRDSEGLHPVNVLETRLATLSISLRKCILQLAQTSAQEMIDT
jgi:hypothetical protein